VPLFQTLFLLRNVKNLLLNCRTAAFFRPNADAFFQRRDKYLAASHLAVAVRLGRFDNRVDRNLDKFFIYGTIRPDFGDKAGYDFFAAINIDALLLAMNNTSAVEVSIQAVAPLSMVASSAACNRLAKNKNRILAEAIVINRRFIFSHSRDSLVPDRRDPMDTICVGHTQRLCHLRRQKSNAPLTALILQYLCRNYICLCRLFRCSLADFFVCFIFFNNIFEG